MTLLYIILGIVGIGLIIFIHECGHFFAAKKVGVRVERFALGFDPPIRGRPLRFFSFKRGETEYILGAIPFGGYVKMAGEIVPETDKEPQSDELLAKSVGARAFVFVAGAAMNIASAFVFFMIAFTIGVPFLTGTIGLVVPGEPAWDEGIRSGDVVVEINGDSVIDFNELRIASALSDEGDVLRLKVRRGEEELAFEVKPRMSEEAGMPRIGLGPAWSPELQIEPAAGTPAARAGLRKGDRIVGARLAGETLPPLPGPLLMEHFLTDRAIAPERPVELQLEDPATKKRRWATLEPRKSPTAKQLPMVQISAGTGTVVRGVRGQSDASNVFQVGDRVLKLKGRAIWTLAPHSLLGTYTEDEVLPLEIESSRGEVRVVDVKRAVLLGWALHGDIHWASYRARIRGVADDSPFKGHDLRPGDVVARVGGKPAFRGEDVERLLREATGSAEVDVLRGDDWLRINVASSPGGDLGVEWNEFPPLGQVKPGGPADRAGIEPGSVITRFGAQEIDSFDRFREIIGDQKIGEPVPIEWLSPSGELRQSEISVGVDSYDVGLDGAISQDLYRRSAGPLESFDLGVRRTGSVIQQVFLILKSLAGRRVHARHLSGPLGIAHVFTDAARSGLGRLFYLLAIVSVNLGIVNLLPLPILDGGHLLFLLVEKIKGSPVSIRVQEIATTAAFFLIIALLFFVTFNDVKRLIQFW